MLFIELWLLKSIWKLSYFIHIEVFQTSEVFSALIVKYDSLLFTFKVHLKTTGLIGKVCTYM